MHRKSLSARWVSSFLLVFAGWASLPAIDLYLTGFDNNISRSVFGKIDTSTGIFTQLADLGSSDSFRGLAWNPAINKFNILNNSGQLNTITTTGTLGTVIANVGQNGTLAYNPNSSTMYMVTFSDLYTLNPNNGVTTFIGNHGANSVSSSTFLNGSLYLNYTSNFTNFYFGTLDVNTLALTAKSGSSVENIQSRLASDGTTLYKVYNSTLYSVDPATGASTPIRALTGLPDGGVASLAAIVPVPEPSTYALATIATGVMTTIARRRRRQTA